MKRRTKHFVLGIGLAYVLSFIAAHAGAWVLSNLGYTGRIPVVLVGGGHRQTVMMPNAAYHAGLYFQTPTLIIVIAAAFLYTEYSSRYVEDGER